MALELFQWFIIGFLLVLPILYELSATFRYHAKFVLYYACILGIATVVCMYGIFRPGDVNNHWFIIWSMKHVSKLFAIEAEVRGKHNLESDKPYILVINHQSSLDCIGVFEIWPSRGCVMAKKDLKYAGPFGLAAMLCGTVFIDRMNHDKALEIMKATCQKIMEKNKELMYAGPFGIAALLCGTVFIDRLNHEKALSTLQKTAKTILDRNIKLLVFPEGTRNHEGSMMPFKKGAFHLAVQAQIPIVPVVFSSYSEFYSKRDRKFTTGKFVITCLPKVPTRGLTAEDVPELTESVRKQMMDTFNQTSLEATQNKLASKMTNGSK